jgi:hypothetical protein
MRFWHARDPLAGEVIWRRRDDTMERRSGMPHCSFLKGEA